MPERSKISRELTFAGYELKFLVFLRFARTKFRGWKIKNILLTASENKRHSNNQCNKYKKLSLDNQVPDNLVTNSIPTFPVDDSVFRCMRSLRLLFWLDSKARGEPVTI